MVLRRCWVFLWCFFSGCGGGQIVSTPSEPLMTLAGPRMSPEDEDSAAREYERRETARECAQARIVERARALVRRGQLSEALELVRGWVAEDPVARRSDSLDYFERHVSWLARVPDVLAELGTAFRSSPRRAFVDTSAGPRVRPGGEPLHVDEPPLGPVEVEVWAETRDFALVALPGDAPAFRVNSDPWAMVGWVAQGNLRDMRHEDAMRDTGRPIPIWRGPPQRAAGLRFLGGTPCDACGVPGLGFSYSEDHYECVAYTELCGAPGLTPPHLGSLEDETIEFGPCMECPVPYRSFRVPGDYCRGPVPGSTWQCDSDGRQLVCLAPE